MTMGSRVLCNEPLLWRTGGLMVSESYLVSPDSILSHRVSPDSILSRPRSEPKIRVYKGIRNCLRRYRYHSLRSFTGELRSSASAARVDLDVVNSASLISNQARTTNTSMLGLQLKRVARTGTTGLRRLATRQLSTAFADDEGPVGVMSETHEMLR